MCVYMDMYAYKSVYVCIDVCRYININRLKISEKTDIECLINYSYLWREWKRTRTVGMLKIDFSLIHLVSVSKRRINPIGKTYF